MNTRLIKKLILLCLLAFFALVNAVFISANEKATINYNYIQKDVNISIYKVASNDGTLCGNFADYQVSVFDKGSAQTLASYAERDNISADSSVKTDSKYTASFRNVDDGIYLITGESTTVGKYKYKIMPSVIKVSGKDVNITAKYEVTDFSGGDDEKTQVAVMKVWSGRKEDQATAQLLKDGEVYAEVILNQDNNWRYTWSDLDDKYTWSVTEKDVPQNYTMSVEKDGSVYVIINKYNTPGGGDEPDETVTETTTETATATETTTSAPKPPSGRGGGGGGKIIRETTTSEPETKSVNEENPEITSSTIDNPDDNSDDDIVENGDNTPSKPDGENSDVDTPNDSDNPSDESKNDDSIPNNDDVDKPDSSNDRDNSKKYKPIKTSKNKLPQTGQLWYPVPILAFAGIMCIIFGLKEKEIENSTV